MAKQTQLGKAFEYACLQSFYRQLADAQAVSIKQTEPYRTAKNFYEQLDGAKQAKMAHGADAAARIILRLEPLLGHADGDSPLFLGIQEDAKGKAGDVRDIVCSREQKKWEFGISCKHNHSAVKHSRLSQTIDFGEKWFGKTCSKTYFEEISPVFTELESLKQRAGLWSAVKDKSKSVYVPLLDSFVKELKRLDQQHPEEIPAQLARYLLGRNDFYKIICHETTKLTTIQAYNLYGTLNQASKNMRPLHKAHPLPLPSKFYDISYKKDSLNTVIVTCDRGWAFSFRIHNASSRVEASLKFDVQIVGMPKELHTQVELWQ